jgi:hypothetical protein
MATNAQSSAIKPPRLGIFIPPTPPDRPPLVDLSQS